MLRTACAGVFLAPSLVQAATITVTSTVDAVAVDGGVTLREAIASINAGANANADVVASGVYGANDEIRFDIAGGCATACRITLASSLGTLTKPATIDGYTQPGARANSLAIGNDAAIRIEIDGDSVGSTGVTLLAFSGGDSTVRGVNVHGGVGHGGGPSTALLSFVSGSDYVVEGNFIGTDPTGSVALPGGGFGGTAVFLSIANGRVGGTAAAQRNLIAGAGIGVRLGDGATSVAIEGNDFGTDASGRGFIGMGTAIAVIAEGGASVGDVTIGGSSSGAGNVIAATLTGGVDIVADASSIGNIMIQGNLIGTDATGLVPITNGNFGVSAVQRSGGTIASVLIGGPVAGARNVISASGGLVLLAAGVVASGVSNLAIQGNLIGVAIDGTTSMGNAGPGIRIDSATARIGGTNAGEGNVIANNRTGVEVVVGSPVGGTGATATILGNSITGNQILGIDLDADGVTPNDVGDNDSGPNRLQNYPVIASTSRLGTRVDLSGGLNSTPNTTFRIEFFSNATCSPAGNGEGRSFLGFQRVTTDGDGNATFVPHSMVVPAGEALFTATATDPAGNTSEFSPCVAAQVAPAAGGPTRIPALSPAAIVLLALLIALAARSVRPARGFRRP
jgi:titin